MINFTHLHKIRSERKSNSHYMALSQCKKSSLRTRYI
ncbi:hypothetical protein [Candidatus Ruthia endofausta]